MSSFPVQFPRVKQTHTAWAAVLKSSSQTEFPDRGQDPLEILLDPKESKIRITVVKFIPGIVDCVLSF